MELRVHRLHSGFVEGLLSHYFEAAGRHPNVAGGQMLPYQKASDLNETGAYWVPAPVWYIEGAKSHILVDTGLPPAEEVVAAQNRYAGTGDTPPRIGPEHDLAKQLGELGLTPGDIDIVILTHLHYDHIGRNELFTNATFIVNRAELSWALCPPDYGYYYYRESRGHILNVLDQIQLVDGDYQVAPGVRMVFAPGHSPGLSLVFVETSVGTVALTSDAVNTYRNIEYEWPSGIWFDFAESVNVLRKLKTADIIVPHHSLIYDDLFPEKSIGSAPLRSETKEYMERIRTAGQFKLSRYSDAHLPKELI